ncbi:MAG: DNA-formamidopyrimidine glycosylase [Candidatus Delongbacteria bacterium]|nr:DNA-formamidopyrimidine glycosylase [Candidatus Delongbacteria bacterium]MBN2835453.1 DNA-formamidopyrimidine glycosylase [Candidatus Delongbacteria bacterium]
MPELPEIETIRIHLENSTPLVIDNCIVYDDRTIEKNHNFAEIVNNSEIIGIKRKGKYLFLELNNGYFISVHLRMTGKFYICDDYVVNNSLSVVFKLKSGKSLIFTDSRKFGRIILLKNSDFDSYFVKLNLGCDALEITLSDFEYKTNEYKNRSIKGFLLDQQIIAGIGNIYSDEILFKSKVKPNRAVHTLNNGEKYLIFENIGRILSSAIFTKNDATAKYISEIGDKNSEFNITIHVYQRENQNCHLCGSKIEKLKLAGRYSRFCPECQK